MQNGATLHAGAPAKVVTDLDDSIGAAMYKSTTHAYLFAKGNKSKCYVAMVETKEVSVPMILDALFMAGYELIGLPTIRDAGSYDKSTVYMLTRAV